MTIAAHRSSTISAAHAGMAFMAAYALVQSLMWAVVRLLGDELSTETLFFFRNLVGFAAVMPLFARRGAGLLRTKRLGMHIARAAATFAGGLSIFYAIAHAPLASVVAVTFAAPVLTGGISMTFMGEGFSRRRIAALGLGFLGVLIVLRPGAEIGTAGLIASLIATASISAAFLLVKTLTASERMDTLIAYPFILAFPASALVAAANWTAPSFAHLPLILAAGGGIMLAQFLMAKAFAAAEASAVLPMDFLRLAAASLLGAAMFGDRIDAGVFIGAAVILGGAIYAARAKPPHSPAIPPAR